MRYSSIDKKILILVSVFVLTLLMRVWLLDKRWINPDEGAHLMDAVLILDGKIPSVDFRSRQPVYAYTNAVILKLFGVNYISGRLLPLACSLSVGILVFLMSFMLFDKKVAFLSASIYWLLPLEVVNSVVVKTEPLVLLLTCLSLSAIIYALHSKTQAWFIAAGIFAALGFYVRQSALIIPLTAIGYLVISYKGRLRDIAKCFSFFLVGYLGVVFMVLIYFSKFMGLKEFFMGDLSPFGFVASFFEKIPSLFGPSIDSVNGTAASESVTPNVTNNLYFNYVREALKLHAFLIIGLGLSIFTFIRQIQSKNKLQPKSHSNSFSLLYLWVFSLLLAYTFYYHTDAFYIDYFREFLPPLVIIFAAWLHRAIPMWEKDESMERFAIVGVCISIITYFVVPHLKEFIGAGIIVSLTLALFTMIYYSTSAVSLFNRLGFLLSLTAVSIIIVFSRHAILAPYLTGIAPKMAILMIVFIAPWIFLTKDARLTVKEYLKFISFALVLGAFALSLTYSANRLTLKYDSVWSTAAVERTAAYLKNNTSPTDTVLSGAVIWELQALRKPFLDITHPLGLEHQIPEKRRERIETAIRDHPPQVIILDGYTERTYLKQVSWLSNLLRLKYRSVHTAEPARYPVQVYQ